MLVILIRLQAERTNLEKVLVGVLVINSLQLAFWRFLDDDVQLFDNFKQLFLLVRRVV